MFHFGVRSFCRHQGSRRLVGSATARSSGSSPSLSSPAFVADAARRGPEPGFRQTSSARPPNDIYPTNGPYLNYSMLYFDSIAFLLSNKLGIPAYIGGDGNCGKTPAHVAAHFNLSLRGASALLVTLCRMNVVQIKEDSDESVDDIVYDLTPAAVKFLADNKSKSFFGTFAETLTTNFITPDALLECARPQEKKDIMSEHLEQNDDEVANNARHFMNHMNSQSYCCAESLPDALGLRDLSEPKTLLDVGGGSAIYTIEAVKSNPNLSGVVFELENIKPLTEEFVEEAGLSDRISVCPGDFFTEDFPKKMNYVLLSNILHDWPDETNLELIEKSYNCLEPGGQVIISELLLDDDVKNSTSASTSMNIIMLPYTKGRQYRPKELKLRLERLGFVNTRHIKLVDDYSLVVATKPQ